MTEKTEAVEAGQRVDKWLWYARFFKSRSIATRLCKGRRLRVNRRIVEKASATVKIGDVLTFPQGNQIKTVQILDPGTRRGPAAEAQLLYQDLSPPAPDRAKEPERPGPVALRPAGAGRPTKSERRATDKLIGGG